MYETGLGTPQIKVPRELGPRLVAMGPELGPAPDWAALLEDRCDVLVWGSNQAVAPVALGGDIVVRLSILVHSWITMDKATAKAAY